MAICLTDDQIGDGGGMTVLSEETFFESGQLFKNKFQSRSLDTCAASSTSVRTFGVCLRIKSHVILHVSKA